MEVSPLPIANFQLPIGVIPERAIDNRQSAIVRPNRCRSHERIRDTTGFSRVVFNLDLEWHHSDPEEIPPTLVAWSLSFGLFTPPFRSKLKLHPTKVGGVFGVRQKFWLGEN